MILTFVVSSISFFIHIAVKIDGIYPLIGLWHVDIYYLHTIYLDRIHITTTKDVFIHLITVDGVPKVIADFVSIFRTGDRETMVGVFLLQTIVYS